MIITIFFLHVGLNECTTNKFDKYGEKYWRMRGAGELWN